MEADFLSAIRLLDCPQLSNRGTPMARIYRIVATVLMVAWSPQLDLGCGSEASTASGGQGGHLLTRLVDLGWSGVPLFAGQSRNGTLGIFNDKGLEIAGVVFGRGEEV